jgi:hypothetical protein
MVATSAGVGHGALIHWILYGIAVYCPCTVGMLKQRD